MREPNEGEVVMLAVAMAGAIAAVYESGDGYSLAWEANADEQIEAALADIGYKLVKIKD
jgi:hypothetical protein